MSFYNQQQYGASSRPGQPYQHQPLPTQQMGNMSISTQNTDNHSNGPSQFLTGRPQQQAHYQPGAVPQPGIQPNISQGSLFANQYQPLPSQSKLPMGGPSSGQQHASFYNVAPPPHSGAALGPPPMSSGMSVGAPPPMNVGAPPPMNGGAALGPPPMNSGASFGPPMSSGMSVGPPPPMSSGMSVGAPPPMNSGPSFGPPPMSSGMSVGPPPMSSGMSVGPPPMSSGMSVGPPPMSSGMSVGPPPMSSGMSVGPPPMNSGVSLGPHTATNPMPGQPGGSSYSSPPGMSYPNQQFSGQHAPPRGPMQSAPGMATPSMAGPVQSQPRPQSARIDPDLMPNPIAVVKADQEQRGNTPYLTSIKGVAPPLVSTTFPVVDQGSCSPRYMRSTLYTVPCSKDLLNQCRIPLGLVIQPLAEVPLNEDNVQVVDHGAGGPIRCNRCKTYMNPNCRFVDGGRQYICPICQCTNEVPPEYFSHIDHTGRRTDVLQRPELMYGTVEYAATKDYCKEGKLPNPPAYIFMIDVSVTNQQSGFVSFLMQTMSSVLDSLTGMESGHSAIRVGFVTYDRVLHFYNVKENLVQPQMMVLTDINDVFVPIVDGFLVDFAESRTVIENLMAMLPDMFTSSRAHEVVLEPVVRAGMEAIKAAGSNGRLFIFHSNLPTAPGPGQLKKRVDVKLLGTDKEKMLLQPLGTSYQTLAQECVKHGVGVELFLFPTDYCDLATLGNFVSTTGGEIHYYTNFQPAIDGDRVIDDLKRSVSRNTGFDCVMRVRCSSGLRAVNFYGGFYMANTTDIELGNIDSDKAIGVEIKHDDKIPEEELAFVQAALLYTNVYGQRRLRIHNLSLNCSTKFSDIYRSCEVDTIVNFFSKSICNAAFSMPYKTIRENFTHQCAVALACYRKQCSSQSPQGQLILPDSLKLLPMYANCLLKSDALLSPPVVTLDEKCWLMNCMMSMNLAQSVSFLYPRLLQLHSMDESTDSLPPELRCTGQKLSDNGAYVVENGLIMVLWAGQHLSPEFITNVFGVSSFAQIDTNMHSLPALDNKLSFRVRGVLSQLHKNSSCRMKVFITKQRDKSEVLFRRMLKEDKGTGPWEGTSYVDYLCQLHREIKEIMS